MVYIYVVFVLCIFILCILISLYTYTPNALYQLCEIYPQLDETFWGLYAYVMPHSANACGEICYVI